MERPPKAIIALIMLNESLFVCVMILHPFVISKKPYINAFMYGFIIKFWSIVFVIVHIMEKNTMYPPTVTMASMALYMEDLKTFPVLNEV